MKDRAALVSRIAELEAEHDRLQRLYVESTHDLARLRRIARDDKRAAALTASRRIALGKAKDALEEARQALAAMGA